MLLFAGVRIRYVDGGAGICGSWCDGPVLCDRRHQLQSSVPLALSHRGGVCGLVRGDKDAAVCSLTAERRVRSVRMELSLRCSLSNWLSVLRCAL
jgi:hypothetical protein|mmetsp:Transcript_52917/g.118758  ORF Transcript_52917/g.118758 Transcript_52917/m.118758 type:complete len:95 (+) Transcript_52917:1888-2172(+)